MPSPAVIDAAVEDLTAFATGVTEKHADKSYEHQAGLIVQYAQKYPEPVRTSAMRRITAALYVRQLQRLLNEQNT